MDTYLAFLRAVNVGGRHPFPGADIRRVVEQAGFADVATHANSGNVRFRTEAQPHTTVAAILQRAFADDRGFEVPTVVFSASHFADSAAETAALDAAHPDIVRHYVYLLPAALDADITAAVEAKRSDAGTMVVRGRTVHALLGPAYTPGRVDPLGAARLLPDATVRNAGVVRLLAAKWCA